MAVSSYSLKSSGNVFVSKHFQVKEFACKDGDDTVKIDMKMVAILEDIRDQFSNRYKEVYIRVGSGYRSLAYNSRIGGANGSYHLYGMAADIDVVIRSTGKVVDPEEVAKYLESRKVLGIGCYKYADGQSWIHTDSRVSKSFWKQGAPNSIVSVKTFYPTLKEQILSGKEKYTTNEDVRVMQQNIGAVSDGKFGPNTTKELKVFQASKGLTADGICGPLTWGKIFA